MKLVIESDGGSRGNPGVAGSGTVVYDDRRRHVLANIAQYIGTATNNVAEYQGLINGLTAARALGATSVVCRLDSKLVVEQMSGRWKIKHQQMQQLAVTAHALAKEIGQVRYEWIPRSKNSAADALANKAMDEGPSVGMCPTVLVLPESESGSRFADVYRALVSSGEQSQGKVSRSAARRAARNSAREQVEVSAVSGEGKEASGAAGDSGDEKSRVATVDAGRSSGRSAALAAAREASQRARSARSAEVSRESASSQAASESSLSSAPLRLFQDTDSPGLFDVTGSQPTSSSAATPSTSVDDQHQAVSVDECSSTAHTTTPLPRGHYFLACVDPAGTNPSTLRKMSLVLGEKLHAEAAYGRVDVVVSSTQCMADAELIAGTVGVNDITCIDKNADSTPATAPPVGSDSGGAESSTTALPCGGVDAVLTVAARRGMDDSGGSDRRDHGTRAVVIVEQSALLAAVIDAVTGVGRGLVPPRPGGVSVLVSTGAGECAVAVYNG